MYHLCVENELHIGVDKKNKIKWMLNQICLFRDKQKKNFCKKYTHNITIEDTPLNDMVGYILCGTS